MACILNIETATSLCSVALSRDGKIVSQRETTEEKSHAGNLTVFIEDILKENNMPVSGLDAIAVGKGPGSYTGLRIGVSVAKGLCYGAKVPLIAINTLRILLEQVRTMTGFLPGRDGILFCPMIDARRMEVFCCVFDDNGSEIEPVSAQIIDNTSFERYLRDHKVAFFGSGMEKCRKVIDHPNALFVEGVLPHASAMAGIAETGFRNGSFEDIAYFEPFYLKDFIATVPKKGLHY